MASLVKIGKSFQSIAQQVLSSANSKAAITKDIIESIEKDLQKIKLLEENI